MYEGAKLITSSRTQGLGSGLCNFAQFVLFSCPFEVGLRLCCVWFSSAISAGVSWPRSECHVVHFSLLMCRKAINNQSTCLGAFKTSLVASLHVDAGELPLELRRQQLCLQYICKLWSNPCNPPAFNSICGTGFRRLFEVRPNTIPTLGIRLNQTIVDSEINLNSIAINLLDFSYPCTYLETCRRFLLLSFPIWWLQC